MMRRSRFTEGQILGIRKQCEVRRAAPDLCRKQEISEQTLYNWKAKYGGLKPSEVQRLKQLQEENARHLPPLATRLQQLRPKA